MAKKALPKRAKKCDLGLKPCPLPKEVFVWNNGVYLGITKLDRLSAETKISGFSGDDEQRRLGRYKLVEEFDVKFSTSHRKLDESKKVGA